MEPWSPASVCSDAESSFGQSKPGLYLIVKRSPSGASDYSSSSKEVVKMMPEKLKHELEEVFKLAHQRSHPDVSNHYDQMLKECEALCLRDPNVEDVKDLRHFIPLFRKICYIMRDDIEKKFKLKSMWNDIPADWPRDICHVDPNNPGADHGKKRLKPKKPELIKMFNHLTQKYKSIREELWMNTFGFRPDEEVDIKTEIKQESDLPENDLQNLANQVENIYANEKSIGKLLKALLKECALSDTIIDPNRWVVFNRQKSILEADLREMVFLHYKGIPHAVQNVLAELKDICKHLSIDPEEVLMLEEEQQLGMIPAIVDQARPPTSSNNRKRKPTLNMDMDGGLEQHPMVPSLVANNFSPVYSDDSIYLEEMDIGNNVDIPASIPDVNEPPSVQVNDFSPEENNYITEGQQAVEALQINYPLQIAPQENTSPVHAPNFSQPQPDPGQPVGDMRFVDVGWPGRVKTEKAQPVSSLQDIYEIISNGEHLPGNELQPNDGRAIPSTINEDDLNDLYNYVINDVMLSS